MICRYARYALTVYEGILELPRNNSKSPNRKHRKETESFLEPRRERRASSDSSASMARRYRCPRPLNQAKKPKVRSQKAASRYQRTRTALEERNRNDARSIRPSKTSPPQPPPPAPPAQPPHTPSPHPPLPHQPHPNPPTCP